MASINATTSSGIVATADNTGQLQLQTTGTTAVTIDTSQNVGIGTTSPAYKLDVVGSLNVTADSFYRIGAGTDRYIQYRTGNSDILYSFASGYFYRQDIGNSNHSWWTANTERMRINSDGNLLVGTTSNSSVSSKLHVSSSNFVVSINGTNTSGEAVRFYSNGSTAGTISYAASSVAYNTSSDYRLKENVEPMQNALNVVQQLKPVTYTWKRDGSAGQGFIAHELQALVPDCVTGEKDAVDKEGNPEYQGVDTSFLVATLTAAIQEQQTIINDLKARVEALEAK